MTVGARHNLPCQLTSFIGRQSAVAGVTAALAGSRLVTLTGAGGCGKTRLAIEVAGRAVGTRGDGTWFVDLSGLHDPSLVPAAVVSGLELREGGGRDPMATLTSQLARRNLLMVLDNCEHLIDTCATLAGGLLQSCPGVTLLVTSREALGVSGETVWRVPSLTLPMPGEERGAQGFEESEAVRLFLDRAHAVRPGAVTSQTDAGAVTEICHRLDGIPLALELAAARVRMMSIEAIAGALSDRFRLLSGGRRAVLPRHQTLRASIDWSYELLAEKERMLLDRLSVFPATFTLAAAEAVGSDGTLGQGEVLDLLSALVDKSLVQAEDAYDRYRLLETVRAYAAEALDASGQTSPVRDRHLRYFVALAEEVEPALWTSGLLSALGRITPELPNVRVALDWSVTSGHGGLGARLVSALGNFFYVLGLRTEGWRRCQELLACDVDVQQRADLIYWAANFAWYTDPSATLRHASELTALGRELQDDRMLARGLSQVGSVQMVLQPREALATLEEAIAAARRSGLETAALDALCFRTWAYLDLGLVGEAFRCGQETIEAGEAIDWLWSTTLARALTALAALPAGELERAGAEVERVLELGSVLGDPLLIELGQMAQAQVAMHRGEPTARDALAAARATAHACGDSTYLSTIGALEGLLDVSIGRIDDGRRRLEEVAADPASLPRDAHQSRAALAEIAVITGDLGAARRYLQVLLPGQPTDLLAGQTPSLPVLRVRARLARAEGDPDGAHRLAVEGMRHAVDTGAALAAVEFLELLCVLAVESRRFPVAGRLLGAAEAWRESAGYRRAVTAEAEVAVVVAHLEAALGTDALTGYRSSGRSMSLEGAAAYAGRGWGHRARPESGWPSLTPTERRVAALVTEGVSNAGIAEQMFVSPVTVKSHLTHIFSKLGVASRRELASAAAARGQASEWGLPAGPLSAT